ncbi:MAG: RNA methyltransferase [Muribaculaceae bacterium]|nr:RNA methyltransferase [Muribaculaceae bacterium]
MDNIIEIESISHPGAAVFASLTEAQLRAGYEAGESIFIAESPKVIRIALNAGYEPIALMCERKHIEGDAADIVERTAGVPVYTAERELLAQITGYKLTRGVLCAMRRREMPDIRSLCGGARRVAVIHGVTDTTNIGTIFRSAAALGVDAVVVSEDSCDPLNRRAIRVSMGTVFQVPWTWSRNPVAELQEIGFKTIAMALTDDSIPLDDPRLGDEPRLAIILGTEGDGLPHCIIADCDYTVKIPMAHGVDSLNVAAASAVAFWQLCISNKSQS